MKERKKKITKELEVIKRQTKNEEKGEFAQFEQAVVRKLCRFIVLIIAVYNIPVGTATALTQSMSTTVQTNRETTAS